MSSVKKVSLGGVDLPDWSIQRLSIQQSPADDHTEAIGPDGTLYQRNNWVKNKFTISGEGREPPLLDSLDYSGPLTLIIDRYTATDTWTEASFSVMARRNSLDSDMLGNWHRWEIECIEVSATGSVPLLFTFSLGGVSPHDLCQLQFSQALSPIVGGSLVRMGSGAGQPREHWRKQGVTLSGGGWVPLNGLDALDYTTAKTLQISELASIDGDGNPVYSTSSYSVWTQGPVHDWDMVARLYRWTLRCEEV